MALKLNINVNVCINCYISKNDRGALRVVGLCRLRAGEDLCHLFWSLSGETYRICPCLLLHIETKTAFMHSKTVKTQHKMELNKAENNSETTGQWRRSSCRCGLSYVISIWGLFPPSKCFQSFWKVISRCCWVTGADARWRIQIQDAILKSWAQFL